MASLLEVKAYFGYKSLKDLKNDWEKLTDVDREQLRTGIGNGTYNY